MSFTELFARNLQAMRRKVMPKPKGPHLSRVCGEGDCKAMSGWEKEMK